MFTGLFLINIAMIVFLLLVISYLLFRRIRSKGKAEEQFKHNIGLLRSEKLLIHYDKKLKKKRQHLLKDTKLYKDVDQKQLMIKSKKLRIPAGELLLAAKIQMCSK